MLKAGIWYLAQKVSAFRTYRVGRMSELQVLDEAYARPAKFDLAAWWRQSSREYEASAYRDSATIRLSPRGRSLLGLLGPYIVEAVTKTASAPDGNGWIRCTIPLESGDLGIRELLRLGADVEVVSPESIRSQMRDALREASERYNDGPRLKKAARLRVPRPSAALRQRHRVESRRSSSNCGIDCGRDRRDVAS